ncbi:UDP-N-acetylmuramoyl-L-alanyl-D-glutamate--2,6-diaminopimelate ligase [Streptomyces gobiensis]|uniref:UDP-N-acetylmuramoyl-L-alanyl-D-glutamate--2, 6-diaminopimelate ligase n=1 Tax=Streptomyces gobiensis TaxID=2875706 RepID=UPI001E353C44|nr:UDP-N-acetylmuramoyl-L-alanyl-D-glutamate--2,6-diaminopimelate ligase [Streptomyces gobiensis]UGY94437.1 UDP-N-acetylmuramoyl-L-alanyl-D-glutamate--2,6-diaminopimelate ligase [Streptomyces gobiensis]
MKLSELLDGHDYQVLQGDPGTPVTAGMSFDVLRLTAGSLYIAVPGHAEGGPEEIGQAVDRGAVAVIIEGDTSGPRDMPENVCVVRVPDTRTVTPVAAARYYGEPGRSMEMVAVTGTNGKTSVSYMVEALLRTAERTRTGVIGTAGSRIGSVMIPMPRSVLTTPESPELQYLLGYMRDRNTSTVVLEATSMALLTHRVDRTFIDVGVFTNLTQDHLDDHGTMESYTTAKLRLFQGLCSRAVVNADDPVSDRIQALMPGAVTTYALDTEADYRATDLDSDAAGTRFTLHHGDRKFAAAIPVPGRFSVSNALATVAACHLLGHDLDALVSALDRMPAVPGRLERWDTPRGATVIVDYAHSPDSLEKVLTTIRGFAADRIITVFGCGGDRDPTKRAPMGRIAGELSDLCVLTSDNPRTESPEAILDQVTPALMATGTPFQRVTDRRAAIRYALGAARPQDIVLVAGKGSEPHQAVGDELIPFDDMSVVRELAREERQSNSGSQRAWSDIGRDIEEAALRVPQPGHAAEG